jgi:hypothetical protein
MDKTKVFKSRIRNKLILILVLLFTQSLCAQKQDFSKLTLRGLTEWENLIIETSLRTKAIQENKNSFVTHFKIKTVEKTNVCYKDSVVGDTDKMYLLEYDTIGLLKLEYAKYNCFSSKEGYCYTMTYLYDSLGSFISKPLSSCAIIDGAAEVVPLYLNEVSEYSSNRLLIKKEVFVSKQMNQNELSTTEVYKAKHNYNKDVPYKTFYYFYNENNLLIRIEEYSENVLKKVSLFNYTYY